MAQAWLLPPGTAFDDYVRFVRRQSDPLYRLSDTTDARTNPRMRYYRHGIQLMRTMVDEADAASLDTVKGAVDMTLDLVHTGGQMAMNTFGPMGKLDLGSLGVVDSATAAEPMRGVGVSTAPRSEAAWPPTAEEADPPGLPWEATGAARVTGATRVTRTLTSPPSGNKVEADSCCDICGYRPRGDPRWFGGSMAKHKRLQHGAGPRKMYRCPYPGCRSQYRSRPDNLRQHQLDKGHFVEGEEGEAGSRRRPSKKRKHMATT